MIDRVAENRFNWLKKSPGILPIKDFWFTEENKQLWKRPKRASEASLRRLACLQAVNKISNLVSIDPQSYFGTGGNGFVSSSSVDLPTIGKSASVFGDEPRIAYVIIGHQNVDSIKHLALSLGYEDVVSLVAIHIDANKDSVILGLSKWLDECGEDCKKIKLIRKSFSINIIWGFSTIIFAILKTLSFAREAAKWDYVAILSGDAYPLRSSSDIVAFMNGIGGKSIVPLRPQWHHFVENPFRLKGPAILPSEDGDYAGFLGGNYKKFWRLRLHHRNKLSSRKRPLLGEQFAILTRDFVWKVEQSNEIATLLARMEFTAAPEEYFFYLASLIIYPTDAEYSKNVDNREIMFKRWPEFPSHPIEVQPDEFPLLEEKSNEYLFTRKIIYSPESEGMVSLFQEIDTKLLNRGPAHPTKI
ncbi:hypothetical protein MP638_005035 [Amoeboaphelidium occidentale]|nr:hypothetical protein MP638_005035 [Amoeboaphelidium occidentale]